MNRFSFVVGRFTTLFSAVAFYVSFSASASGQEAKLKAILPEVFGKCAAHYRALDAAATPLMNSGDPAKTVPRGDKPHAERLVPHGWDAKTGKLDMRSIYWWTSGHFPGSLWYIYEGTGDAFFKERATVWTESIAPNSKVSDNHDVGFIMYCSFGNARRLLKTDRYDDLLRETAESLSKRFCDRLGLIRSWGEIGEKRNFSVIPDNMMNLELLEWASKNPRSPEDVPKASRFDRIARSHATKTMAHHFRADGGTYHVLDYDQDTLRVKGIMRGQGASCETAWSRGQSWAIYGYTMMYRETKDPAYLDFAVKVSDFAIAHPNMPADRIPFWDYGAPGEERDTSAAAIMASGLLELSTFVPGEKGAKYREFAVSQLISLCSDAYFAKPGENGNWILMHGVGHKPGRSEIDTPLDYGDYYFLEALLRFRDLAAVSARQSCNSGPGAESIRADSPSPGISKSGYLDFMEAAVRAYSDERLVSYHAEAERDGVQEHGFPRLAANLAILVANGRISDKRELSKKMMDVACRDARKGKMPPKSGGNEFSVKELAIALVELERRGTFPKNVTDAWREDLMAVDAARCYDHGKIRTDLAIARNWVVFGCASEQARIRRGLGGNAGFVEKYVADQLRWFDSNGMYRDPNQPMVYDLVTRLQFAQILDDGFAGSSRKELERLMDLSAEPTLKMLSVCGEIPYGGRSNQFLHNNTFYSALCEWYAARFARNGDMARASEFRRAAAESADAMRSWLGENPVSHVKNRYPRESGKGVYSEMADIGCERYAYFDKYMITMGSWAILGWHFCDESIPAAERVPAKPDVFLTSPTFHVALMNAGEYSAQFDYCANEQYDCNGLGRLHRRGAPAELCMSTPCAKDPNYRIPEPNPCSLAIRPVVEEDSRWCIMHEVKTAEYALAKWKVANLDLECRLSKSGMEMALSGRDEVSMELPAFEFDGKESTRISHDANSLSVYYRGWVCRYRTDGRIEHTGTVVHNRNGRYAAFKATGLSKLKVWIEIFPESKR